VCRYILISCFASVGLNSHGQPPLPAVVLPPAAIPAPPKPDVKALPRIEIERPVPPTPLAVRQATERVETSRIPYREREMAATIVNVPGKASGSIELVVYNLSVEPVALTIGDRLLTLPKRSRQTLPVTGPISWSLGAEKTRFINVPNGTASVEIYLNR
jgi:hypothetical protein